MAELSTGLVLAGAYADKLRRTLFAQMRDKIKSGEIQSSEVARASAELNRLLYIILVDNLGIDKGDVVRIRVEYNVEDGKIKWQLDSLRIEYFKRVEIEEGKLRELVEKAMKQVAGEREEEVRAEEVREEAPSLQELSDVVPLGETEKGEQLIALKSADGKSLGIAALSKTESGVLIDAVLVPAEGKAYRATITSDKPLEALMENSNEIVDIIKAHKTWSSLDPEDAKKVIEEKMKGIR